MKKLFLIRHAKSSWSDPAVSDFYRTLNKRGKKDAPFMAAKLAETGAHPDIILSSPAKRAKKTACFMAKGVGYPTDSIVYDDNIYSASTEELFRVLKKVDKKYNELYLVGHNFAITDLAVVLTDVVIDNIPTSGIAAMECRIKKWSNISPGCGKILFFDFPKKYDKRR
jgi:phosphohistidine phosphatase